MYTFTQWCEHMFNYWVLQFILLPMKPQYKTTSIYSYSLYLLSPHKAVLQKVLKGILNIHTGGTITQPVVSWHDEKRHEPNLGVTG